MATVDGKKLPVDAPTDAESEKKYPLISSTGTIYTNGNFAVTNHFSGNPDSSFLESMAGYGLVFTYKLTDHYLDWNNSSNHIYKLKLGFGDLDLDDSGLLDMYISNNGQTLTFTNKDSPKEVLIYLKK